MIGVFAIHGDRVYFNEMLIKGNFQHCMFPLENWFIPNRKQFFIPLSASAVTVLDMFQDAKFQPEPIVMVPELCGILICADSRIYEVGMGKDGLPAMKRVPIIFTNPLAALGVRYVRAHHRDMEESFTAALRITDRLEKANDLMRQATVGLPGKPIYARLGQLIWGAITQDAKLIRTPMTHYQLRQHVKKTMPKVVAEAKLAKSAEAKKSTD